MSQIDCISRIIYVAHIFSAPSSSVHPSLSVCPTRFPHQENTENTDLDPPSPATLKFVAGGSSCLGRVFSPPEGEYALVCHSCRRRPSSNLEGKIVGGGRFRPNPPALSVKHATIPPSQDKSTLPRQKHPSETNSPSLHMSALPPRKHPLATYKPELQNASPQVQVNGEYPCLVIEEKTLWTMPVTM